MATRRSAGRRTGEASNAGALTAFVLHQYDWSESSLIVEVFTRERGRLAIVAKGAKRPTSNFRAVLLPLRRLQLTLGRSPGDAGEIHTLRAAELLGRQDGWPRGSAGLMSAFYLHELLLKFLPREDAHAALFDCYALCLPQLAAGEAAARGALRAFELVLLRELGWLPQLDRITATQLEVSPRRSYRIDPENGVLEAEGSDKGLSGGSLLALESALEGQDFPAALAAAAEAAQRLRAPLRQLLQYHLGTTALRTPQVLQGVQTLIAP